MTVSYMLFKDNMETVKCLFIKRELKFEVFPVRNY